MKLRAAGDLTVLYKIATLPQAVHEQAELLDEAARVTTEGMARLRTLQKLEDYWIRINEIENLADALYRALLAQVFDNGSDVVTMIKIKEVVDQLELRVTCRDSVWSPLVAENSGKANKGRI
jgi:uncharacterized protein